MTAPSAAGESRDLRDGGAPAPADSASPAGPGRGPRDRASVSPIYGAIAVSVNLLSTLTLITYTLLPLPGQRSIGWWNYIIAAGFFVASLTLAPIFQARDDRVQAAARAGSRTTSRDASGAGSG